MHQQRSVRDPFVVSMADDGRRKLLHALHELVQLAKEDLQELHNGMHLSEGALAHLIVVPFSLCYSMSTPTRVVGLV